MLPRIIPEWTLQQIYQEFLADLRQNAYPGEIHSDYATRLSVAVDNSIYQVIPEAVIFPKTTQDISTLLHLANQEKYRTIKFCGRGGGTSTNGQSLSAGIIIDCSKYMRNILELNLKEGWVRVQPGVVLDQLNTYLKPQGVCFAPEISPSNRATIGGMVNTDACGIGSRILGRTSDHVVDLTCVMRDGNIIHTIENNHQLTPELHELIAPHQSLIDEKFTSAPRTLNGYNLKKALVNQAINLNYLICGSEGTLAIVSECKLKLTPIPKHRNLVVVKYRSFDDALRAADLLNQVKPFAVEAIDEKLIDLARQDPSYVHIKDFIDEKAVETRAVNLVEFVSEHKEELEKLIYHFVDVIIKNKNLSHQAIGYYVAKNPDEEKLLWDLRKKSVGFISKKQDGTRRPIPFIEDTAVPPENLAAYISEFKKLLDQYHLQYGMYGHVDAGCVHVRPALDMKLSHDENLMKELSNEVVALLEKHGGVLWGEHGHGYRSEYGERFFGKTLYHVVRQVKTLFDPFNQLNPGKIATSLTHHEELVKLTGPMRGQFDNQVAPELRESFATTMACNGNGACFNYATADTMCPSYKVTQDRVQSPKGRATVMREWLRQITHNKVILNINKKTTLFKRIFNSFSRKPDFSNEVLSAMSGCLSCKACATQCPLSVDVPEFKATFLAYYYQRYFRPLRDYFIASLETTIKLQVKFPRMSRWFLKGKFTQYLLRKILKIIDPPILSSISLKQEFENRNIPEFNVKALKNLTSKQKSLSIILLQDSFTSYYDTQVLLATYDGLTKLGVTVYIAPFFPSGKPLHVKGFLKQFKALVNKNELYLRSLASLDIPIVGIDPSITLTYRDEYQKLLGNQTFKVFLLQEWLLPFCHSIDKEKLYSQSPKNYYLLSHCTEKTMCVQAEKQWQTIFSVFGFTLTVLPSGCCGMAGSYGHEVEHMENSRQLFNMDWQKYLEKYEDTILATGYSCRSQTNRFMQIKLQHPIEVLSKCFNKVLEG